MTSYDDWEYITEETRPPPLSRVHELARMGRTELTGIYLDMAGPGTQSAVQAVQVWDKDQIITAIRNLEDPQ